MTKQFLIQVTPDERTRMLADDERLREGMQTLIESCFKVFSTGPLPSVTVEALPMQGASKLRQAIMRVCVSDPGSTKPEDCRALCEAVQALRDAFLPEEIADLDRLAEKTV